MVAIDNLLVQAAACFGGVLSFVTIGERYKLKNLSQALWTQWPTPQWPTASVRGPILSNQEIIATRYLQNNMYLRKLIYVLFYLTQLKCLYSYQLATVNKNIINDECTNLYPGQVIIPSLQSLTPTSFLNVFFFTSRNSVLVLLVRTALKS